MGFKTHLDENEARRIFLKWVDIHQKALKKKGDKEIIEEQEKNKPDSLENTYTPTLLEVLRKLSPKGFEDICKRLLREHGFENVEVTGGSHDGGIDGSGL